MKKKHIYLYMKLLDLLYESLTDTVYHYTGIENLVQILKKDEIYLSFNLTDDKYNNRNRGKYFYLSLTRSKSLDDIFDFAGYAKIVFDGRKLNHNFKSIPYNFFRGNYKSSEQEDRIISDKSSIFDICKFIKEIHVLDKEYVYFGFDKDVNQAVFYANKRNIPIYVYQNYENFKFQKNPIHDLSYLKIMTSDSKLEIDREFINLSAFIAYNNKNGYYDILNYINEHPEYNLSKEEFVKVLEKNSINVYKPNSIYLNNELDKIKNTLSYKLTHKPTIRFLVKLLVNDMKKFNTSNLKNYIIYKNYNTNK